MKVVAPSCQTAGDLSELATAIAEIGDVVLVVRTRSGDVDLSDEQVRRVLETIAAFERSARRVQIVAVSRGAHGRPRVSSEAIDRHIVRLHTKGISINMISKLTGISKSSVHRRITEWKDDRSGWEKNATTPQDAELLLELAKRATKLSARRKGRSKSPNGESAPQTTSPSS